MPGCEEEQGGGGGEETTQGGDSSVLSVFCHAGVSKEPSSCCFGSG